MYAADSELMSRPPALFAALWQSPKQLPMTIEYTVAKLTGGGPASSGGVEASSGGEASAASPLVAAPVADMPLDDPVIAVPLPLPVDEPLLGVPDDEPELLEPVDAPDPPPLPLSEPFEPEDPLFEPLPIGSLFVPVEQPPTAATEIASHPKVKTSIVSLRAIVSPSYKSKAGHNALSPSDAQGGRANAAGDEISR
jgi:hypothetical protein